ncbi:hypothetical protein D9613_009717 [Agrocybe pediades]|uniref:Uncharacterized protein n=1 Tax=Agrocybe pediades TaxID=84607 RepID=A0A8H4QY26_9AGAR|nr:hypothetical protein D9613_009717 [Agrocybe pediades]
MSVSVPTNNLANLNGIKNAVTGNPLAKAEIATDELLVSTLFDFLDAVSEEGKAFRDTLRMEAARVGASLPYGIEHALGTLCKPTHRTPSSTRSLISRFNNFDSNTSCPAFLIIWGIHSGCSGPLDVGLRPDSGAVTHTKHRVQKTLNDLF